jgi:hypothetical protein
MGWLVGEEYFLGNIRGQFSIKWYFLTSTRYPNIPVSDSDWDTNFRRLYFMTRSLFSTVCYVCLLPVFLLFNTGCELSETCDPTFTVCTEPYADFDGIEDYTLNNNDVSESEDVDLSESEDADSSSVDLSEEDNAEAELNFHYVMIEDLQNPDAPGSPLTTGVDIFGIQLEKDGTLFNASRIHSCEFGDGDNSFAQGCSNALGIPVPTCESAGTEGAIADYVSLGGIGGRLIVSFGDFEEIVEGNLIRVFECGTEQNPGELDEFYTTFIGASSDALSDSWTTCLLEGSGETECAVPVLTE